MKRLSKLRIKRILEKHCVMVNAEFFKPVTDEFGDMVSTEKYAVHNVYFSQLLHRYNPYVDLRIDNDNTIYRRRTPMAILPYDKPLGIEEFHIVRIESRDYTISFCEDIKGYYYLLSLVPKE